MNIEINIPPAQSYETLLFNDIIRQTPPPRKADGWNPNPHEPGSAVTSTGQVQGPAWTVYGNGIESPQPHIAGTYTNYGEAHLTVSFGGETHSVPPGSSVEIPENPGQIQFWINMDGGLTEQPCLTRDKDRVLQPFIVEKIQEFSGWRLMEWLRPQYQNEARLDFEEPGTWVERGPAWDSVWKAVEEVGLPAHINLTIADAQDSETLDILEDRLYGAPHRVAVGNEIWNSATFPVSNWWMNEVHGGDFHASMAAHRDLTASLHRHIPNTVHEGAQRVHNTHEGPDDVPRWGNGYIHTDTVPTMQDIDDWVEATRDRGIVGLYEAGVHPRASGDAVIEWSRTEEAYDWTKAYLRAAESIGIETVSMYCLQRPWQASNNSSYTALGLRWEDDARLDAIKDFLRTDESATGQKDLDLLKQHLRMAMKIANRLGVEG